VSQVLNKKFYLNTDILQNAQKVVRCREIPISLPSPAQKKANVQPMSIYTEENAMPKKQKIFIGRWRVKGVK
jgi:hypothetical protein